MKTPPQSWEGLYELMPHRRCSWPDVLSPFPTPSPLLPPPPSPLPPYPSCCCHSFQFPLPPTFLQISPVTHKPHACPFFLSFVSHLLTFSSWAPDGVSPLPSPSLLHFFHSLLTDPSSLPAKTPTQHHMRRSQWAWAQRDEQRSSYRPLAMACCHDEPIRLHLWIWKCFPPKGLPCK